MEDRLKMAFFYEKIEKNRSFRPKYKFSGQNNLCKRYFRLLIPIYMCFWRFFSCLNRKNFVEIRIPGYGGGDFGVIDSRHYRSLATTALLINGLRGVIEGTMGNILPYSAE